jgi:hypothetical protein
MLNLYLGFCINCRQRRLGLQITNDLCSRSSKSHNKLMYTHESKALPTWTEKGKNMYHVPKELSNLSIAEKLLIQRVSPLIPVIHIKNGILGSRGHIVSFFQDITSIVTVLPRLPSEVTIVKVIREGINKEGVSCRNNFQVNRIKVLNTLRWLQKNKVL